MPDAWKSLSSGVTSDMLHHLIFIQEVGLPVSDLIPQLIPQGILKVTPEFPAVLKMILQLIQQLIPVVPLVSKMILQGIPQVIPESLLVSQPVSKVIQQVIHS